MVSQYGVLSQLPFTTQNLDQMFSILNFNAPALPSFISVCVFRSKVGGLADVLASLPTALAAR